MLYLSGYENGMRRRKTKCGLTLVDNRASHGAVISSFQCFLFCRFFGVSYTTDEILCQKSSHSKWIFHEANNMLNSGERLMLYSSVHVYTAKVPRSRIAFGCCCFSFFLLSSPPLSSDPWAHIARFVRDTPQQASLCVCAIFNRTACALFLSLDDGWSCDNTKHLVPMMSHSLIQISAEHGKRYSVLSSSSEYIFIVFIL